MVNMGLDKKFPCNNYICVKFNCSTSVKGLLLIYASTIFFNKWKH